MEISKKDMNVLLKTHHLDPNDPDSSATLDEQDGQFPEGMFRFEKRIENQ